MAQVVLITGASSGFGRAAAQLLAGRGHTVFATMRDTAGRNAASAAALRDVAHVLELDVTDERSVNAAVQRALDAAGRIDVAINNAGFANLGVTEAYTVAQFQQLFDTNVYGSLRVNRAVLPAMRKQRSGLLIHVSSGVGRMTVPYMAAYSASKAALEAIADSYRFELRPFGIDSVVVEPGIHRTEILQKMWPPEDAARAAEYDDAAQYVERVAGTFAEAARGDAADPAEVAECFVRLVEMAPGDRPFRTVTTERLRRALEPYNAMAAELRSKIAHGFHVDELAGATGTAV
jgi:NAD(P)-dependent dehydrogenase (short-subunit alcohol dehydrogenase family)